MLLLWCLVLGRGKQDCSHQAIDMASRYVPQTWTNHLQTPKRLLKGHSSWVLVVAWSPDAALIGSGEWSLVDLLLHVSVLALDGLCNGGITGDHDGGVCLWEPETGRALGQCKVRGSWSP